MLRFSRSRLAMMVADKNLRYYIKTGAGSPDSKYGRPEIDRYQLRQILLNSLQPGTVKWKCRLRKVDEERGMINLHFDHGIETGFDLVVGADGAWSKVRPLVS